MINSAKDYTILQARKWEYDGSVESTCINRFFSNFLLRMHNESNTNVNDYGTGSIVCHLLLSGNYDEGYFDVLQKYNIYFLHILNNTWCIT